jgi:hypothetical protein
VKSGIRLWSFSARIQPFYSRFMPYTAPETALGIIDLGHFIPDKETIRWLHSLCLYQGQKSNIKV